MKSLRKSRSTENRNARKTMATRSLIGTPAATLLPPDMQLRGRNLRRASRTADRRGRTPLTGAVRSLIASVAVLQADGTMSRPTVRYEVDPFTRLVTGYEVS